jgi:hypothetical protein
MWMQAKYFLETLGVCRILILFFVKERDVI